MSRSEDYLRLLEETAQQIISEWYERVTPHYVTEEESRQLGVEPEVKLFQEKGSARIKFARTQDVDVTYGLGGSLVNDRLLIESSVNNKSEGFEFEGFVEKLKAYYWRGRHEKPWTEPEFDRFTYGDLTPFEPIIGESVFLNVRGDKADIIRLVFPVNPRHENQIMSAPKILRDLVENYCLHPLKRIYAESYREQ